MFAGTKTASDVKLIGIIVGVVIACILLLIILGCCWFQQRRKARAAAEGAAATKAGQAVDTTADSIYVQGIKVDASGGADTEAINSPEHREKMEKLQAMTFMKTKGSGRGQLGAVGSSPRAEGIGAKGFAFPNVTTQASGAFGSPMSTESPVYTPRGTNIISKLFSPRVATQVSDLHALKSQSAVVLSKCLLRSTMYVLLHRATNVMWHRAYI